MSKPNTSKSGASRKFVVGAVLKTDEPIDIDYETNLPTYWDEDMVKGELMSWLSDLGFEVHITVEEM